MTSTATLQAALDVTKNKDPSIGYSIAYPFGVIGPILLHLFHDARREAEIPGQGPALSHGGDFVGEDLRRSCARRIDDEALDDVQVTMIRKAGLNPGPTDDTVLSAGDVVLVIAESKRPDPRKRRGKGLESSSRAGWPATVWIFD